MNSQQSANKKRGGGLTTLSMSTPQKYNASSANKKIRRLGSTNNNNVKDNQVSASIEMMRTGGTKVTAYLKAYEDTSIDPTGKTKTS